MGDSQPPEKVTWLAWLKSFTPLEVLLSCTFTMATVGFVLALVARLLLPLSGCEDPCRRDFPEEFEPMLSRRFQGIPDNEVVGRRGQSTVDWNIEEPRELRAGEFPFLGSINNAQGVACIMMIISQRWCMTAANCYKLMSVSTPLTLMERDTRGALIGGYDILEVVGHNTHKAGESLDDITVIKSTTDFKLGKNSYFVFASKREDLDIITGNVILLMAWQFSKSKGADSQAVINCWPTVLPSDRKLNTTAAARERAVVLAYGQKVHYILGKKGGFVDLCELKDWVQNIILG